LRLGEEKAPGELFRWYRLINGANARANKTRKGTFEVLARASYSKGPARHRLLIVQQPNQFTESFYSPILTLSGGRRAAGGRASKEKLMTRIYQKE
jgi:hypothetical protein